MPSKASEQALLNGEYLLTIQQVCKILCLSRSSVYGLIRRGELPCFRIGRSVRLAASDVRAYLLQRKAGAESQE